MIKCNTVGPLSHYSTVGKHGGENCEGFFVVGDGNCLSIRKSFEKFAESRGLILKFFGRGEQAHLDNYRKGLLRIFFDWVSNSTVCDSDIRTLLVRVKIQHREKCHQHQGRTGSVAPLMLTVAADGMGISPEKLATLFYRFCRFENRRISRAKLSSGLLFAKITLDLKGANISIESKTSIEDKKIMTQFELILPMGDESRSNDLSSLESAVTHRHDNDVLIENFVWEHVGGGINNSRSHAASPSDDQFLNKLMALLEYHICDPDFNVSKLVSEIGMSRPVLFRKAKILTGSSIINLIRSRRLQMAEMLLKQKKVTVSEVGFKVGYTDPKYFSKSFRSEFGKTPREYVHALQH